MLGLLKMCYICLERNSKDLTEVTTMDYDSLTYLYKLKTCISLDLDEDNSKQICSTCVKQLRISYQFREMVLLSQTIIEKNKNDLISGTYVEESRLNHLRVEAINLLCEPECVIIKEEQFNTDASVNEIPKINNKTLNLHVADDEDDDGQFLQITGNDDVNDSDNSEYFLSDLKDDLKNNGNNNFSNNCFMEQIKDDENIATQYQCAKCNLLLGASDLRNHICDIKCFETDDTKDITNLNSTNEELLIKNKRGRPKKKLKGGSRSELEYQCYNCDMVFNKRWKLQKHISRVHSDSKKYICTYCNKAFKQSYHLREHLTSHTGERNYTCSFCEKSFQRLSSMRRHIRSHEAAPGQKTKRTPFLCTMCGKSFPFSNGVQRHMRIHLGIKNHECSICHRRFTQSTHLHVHMRTHTGEKPYICDTCGEAFSLNASLQKHMMVHQTLSN